MQILELFQELPASVAPPDNKPVAPKMASDESLAALGVGVAQSEILHEILKLRRMASAPGMPVRNDEGQWELGPKTDWFPSRGSGRNGIMFVGAYPSGEETKQRRIMVGPSGQFLINALLDLRIRWEDCLITNVIHYALPAGTAVPKQAVKQCLPYLQAEIDHFKPKLIICVGAVAFNALMGEETDLEQYRGEKFQLPDRPYQLGVLWQPAYVLRDLTRSGTWKDDLALILDRKPLPDAATDYRVQDKLPTAFVTKLRDLEHEVKASIQAGDTQYTIDTEFVGDDPRDSLLLSIQIASASRTINILLNEGNWKPKIYPKSTGKEADVPTLKPELLIDQILDNGYDATAEKTKIPHILLLNTVLENQPLWKEAEQKAYLKLCETQGPAKADLWRLQMETKENLLMAKGTVMVFNTTNELNEYLMQNPKLRNNLIAYTLGGRPIFDADLKAVGQALRPLFFNRSQPIAVRGHNVNVDLNRIKCQLDLDLVELNDIDTMLLALVLDEGQPRGLEDLCRRYLNAPNHKLEVALHLRQRGLKGQSYCFIKPSLLWKYGNLDARRNHDIVAPMMSALTKETVRIYKDIRTCNVPRLKVGETPRSATAFDTDLAVNDWPNGNYLFDAFFKYKMPQSRALAQPMELGQPINMQQMGILIDWYQNALKTAIAKCQKAAQPYWNPKGDRPDFSPSSPDQTAELLFIIRGLKPIKATDKKDKEWTEEKDEEWRDAILDGRKPKCKPATDSETLDLLAEKDELAKIINDTRFIGTLVKNYLRKGGRWRSSQADSQTRGLAEASSNDFKLMADDELDTYLQDMEAAIEQERQQSRERWQEHEKDQNSRAISLLVTDDGKLFSNYYATLESHRLATVPNVSAIVRGESRYVKDIVGTAPPSEIRQLNEAPNEWFIISVDWKSAEVWMIGMLSWLRSKLRGHEMDNLLKIISDPSRCVHSSTARKMFPATLKDLTDKQIKKQYGHLRDLAKPVVFGIPYGRGANAIAQQLNRNAITSYLERLAKGETVTRPKEITKEEANTFITAYYEMAPECWDFLNEQKSLVIRPGFQVSPWGFVRRFPRVTKEEEIANLQREASNWQIQGGVAMAMQNSTARWREHYSTKYPKMQMYLIDILHDACKFLLHRSMLPYYEEIIDDIMGKGLKLPFEHPIPLGYDISFYKAYERKDFNDDIDLEAPADAKAHGKTFLGKYGDSPENRAFYTKHGRKADFVHFLLQNGATEADMDRKLPLQLALAS